MLKSAPLLVRYLAYSIMSALVVISVSYVLVHRAASHNVPITIDSLGDYYLPDADATIGSHQHVRSGVLAQRDPARNVP